MKIKIDSDIEYKKYSFAYIQKALIEQFLLKIKEEKEKDIHNRNFNFFSDRQYNRAGFYEAFYEIYKYSSDYSGNIDKIVKEFEKYLIDYNEIKK